MRALVVPAMRRRWVWTLGLLAVFRLGQAIPAPGARRDGWVVDGLLDLLTGGGLHRLSLLALGVAPLLLAPAVQPLLSRLAPDRPEHERTAWPARLSALVLGAALAVLVAATAPASNRPLLAVSLTLGTALTVALAELLSRYGVADGASVLFLVQLLAVVPGQLREAAHLHGPVAWAVLVPVVVVVLAGLTAARTAERRVPIGWAKRMVGVRPPGGGGTYLPFRLGQAWHPAMIAALLLLHLPAAIGLRLREDGWVYLTVLPLLVLLLTLLGSAPAADPTGHADRLARQGAYIPGIRPGRPTAEYLAYVGRRVALAGALLAAIVALLPALATALSGTAGQVSGTALLLLAVVAVSVTGQVLHRAEFAYALWVYPRIRG